MIDAVPDALVQQFRARFGRAPAVAARAPGRVNLIGEHTDYNDGLVLPCAVDRATWVVLAPREDARVRVWSRERAEEGVRELGPAQIRMGVRGAGSRPAGPTPAPAGPTPTDWTDYVRAALEAVDAADTGAGAEATAGAAGADVAIASELPLGSGLSSSAALCVALVTALDAVSGGARSARERAELAHRAEHDFVGVPCGIMDPFASALGREGHALRLDCRSRRTQPVALPPLSLLLVHSGVTRRLAASGASQGGGYAGRRGECLRAFAAARAAGIAPPGATALRDLDAAALPALARALPDALFRRARHVITENARVEDTCAALRAGDREAAGACLREGMRSLREDFEVSLPELDVLCALGDATPGVFGSRLTGAGFGGCTLHLAAPEAAEAAADALAEGFARRFGRRPPVFAVSAADGARAFAP